VQLPRFGILQFDKDLLSSIKCQLNWSEHLDL
jgi:hypothetical protein